jgi:uncharacterized protein YdeI (BOF family)
MQGVLALLAFALLLVVAAHALRPLDKNSFDTGFPPAVQAAQEPQQPATAQDGQQPPNAKAESATVFHGTIVKDGSDFVLRDQSGTVYRLDAPSKAKPFEGKSVKLTGRVEKDARLIHVQDIQASATA